MLFAPNPRQKTAIEHERGPMLVVAGAGTGKTTVLVERVARLVANKIAKADEILCVTYMRNAARELRERIAARTGAQPQDIQAYTIHGYCEQVLRRAGERRRLQGYVAVASALTRKRDSRAGIADGSLSGRCSGGHGAAARTARSGPCRVTVHAARTSS